MMRLLSLKNNSDEKPYPLPAIEVDDTGPLSVTPIKRSKRNSMTDSVAEPCSPTDHLQKSVKKQVKDTSVTTPTRTSKRLVGKRKLVPLFTPPKSAVDSSDESPKRNFFATSDPFYSPKQDANVPDVHSPIKKPILDSVLFV
jgi:hypothetical protein